MKSLSVALFAGTAASFLLPIPPVHAAVTEKVLYSFCSQQYCTDGELPYAGVLNVKGTLYTTTNTGGGNGSNAGTLVSVDMATGAATVLYSFANYAGDAAAPEAGLIKVNGALYGTTAEGGAGDNESDAGALYSLEPKTGKETVSYSFCNEKNCADGATPTADVVSVNGLLYGTTVVGGGGVANCFGPHLGCGTVFSLDPATGAEKVLYVFCALSSCADGSEPVGSLIAVNGTLYGTTADGGGGSGCSDMGLGCGTVFGLDPNTGAETVLHVFGGETDGGTPVAGLINVNGRLYGTTEYGGGNFNCGYEDGCGTIFSIDPVSGAETIIHSFKDNGKDGQNPVAGLIELKGKLYGTTENGGAYGYGTVFSLDLSTGREKVVYSFCSLQRCNDGANPYAGLIEVRGTLYGTTEGGGTGDQGFAIGGGTVFSITP